MSCECVSDLLVLLLLPPLSLISSPNSKRSDLDLTKAEALCEYIGWCIRSAMSVNSKSLNLVQESKTDPCAHIKCLLDLFQVIRKGEVSCCWTCTPCKENEFVFDEYTCRACELGSWPNDELTGQFICLYIFRMHSVYECRWGCRKEKQVDNNNAVVAYQQVKL